MPKIINNIECVCNYIVEILQPEEGDATVDWKLTSPAGTFIASGRADTDTQALIIARKWANLDFNEFMGTYDDIESFKPSPDENEITCWRCGNPGVIINKASETCPVCNEALNRSVQP